MTVPLNVNQFALPGMEEHAHAGAQSLTQGRGFLYSQTPDDDKWAPGEHHLEMYGPDEIDRRMVRLGHISWSGSKHVRGYYPGEISGVGTSRFNRREGIASTLYKMAADPSVHTGDDTIPLHSPSRTREGLKWSAAVGGWDPDLDDPADRPRHPFEDRADEIERRRPKVPDPQDHVGGQTSLFDPITLHRLKKD